MAELMDIRDIRKLSDEKLNNEYEDQKEALFNLRFQKAAGQMEDTNALKRTRRHIARLLMVMRERERAAQQTK
ncbi:MAG: 50S ribosomal protein L29 [Chloroflexota bacterium]|nr:50S ribosomal protein L29 [Chloroflexota bacterium]